MNRRWNYEYQYKNLFKITIKQAYGKYKNNYHLPIFLYIIT